MEEVLQAKEGAKEMPITKILKTEYSEEFDQLAKNRVIVSYFKYGAAETNYANGLIDAIKSCEMRIAEYKKTGNAEFLVDAKNFLMFEFMFPQHPKAYFKATDSDGSPGIAGTSIEEIKQWGSKPNV